MSAGVNNAEIMAKADVGVAARASCPSLSYAASNLCVAEWNKGACEDLDWRAKALLHAGCGGMALPSCKQMPSGILARSSTGRGLVMPPVHKCALPVAAGTKPQVIAKRLRQLLQP